MKYNWGPYFDYLHTIQWCWKHTNYIIWKPLKFSTERYIWHLSDFYLLKDRPRVTSVPPQRLNYQHPHRRSHLTPLNYFTQKTLGVDNARGNRHSENPDTPVLRTILRYSAIFRLRGFSRETHEVNQNRTVLIFTEADERSRDSTSLCLFSTKNSRLTIAQFICDFLIILNFVNHEHIMNIFTIPGSQTDRLYGT